MKKCTNFLASLLLAAIVMSFPATTVFSQTAPSPQTLASRAGSEAAATNAPGKIDGGAASQIAVKLPAAESLTFCDAEFKSVPFDFVQPSATTLGDLLEYLSEKYAINFLPDAEVVELPVRLNVRNVPWHIILKQQLAFLDLESQCISDNTVAVLKRAKATAYQDNLRKQSPTTTTYIKLRYLQPSSGGQVNIAGKSAGGAGSAFESLEAEIQKILRGDGDNRGAVGRVPGKNVLIITGTSNQIARIREIIQLADRPSYQVIVRALVYTANESKLKDVGSQLSAVLGGNYRNGVPNVIGGIGTIPNSGSAGVDPVTGVGSLPSGIASPDGSLVAASPNSVFGLSGIFGAAQFSYQLTLAQQRGAINIQNRPFTIVMDGDSANLDVGRQIPVLIQSAGISNSPGSLEILSASNILQLTPQVIEDENNKPIAVNLNLRLESNEVDSAVISQGVPSVNRRSIQTRFVINADQTVVLGGFTTDAVNQQRSKTPGLGDIPILGNLFKRRQTSEQRDRLYFAISVSIVPQEEPLNTVPVPKDAVTTPVAAPAPQFPSPYEDKEPVKSPKKKDQ